VSKQKLVETLVSIGAVAQREAMDRPFFTPNKEAEALLRSDPFAFLLGVIFDQSIDAQRAWEAPLELKKRLGHLDPGEIWNNEAATREAISRPPALHRFVNTLANWVRFAAFQSMGMERDVTRLWSDEPTAAELQKRLCRFKGIGQKKAAMAVELLERHLGVKVRELEGGDVAYDVHVRRVFLRTGLARRDKREDILAAARKWHPERPGALDYGAWRLGRSICRARNPSCDECPLEELCPKFIGRGDAVHVT
jgi:uncharacterized HhH-GPD family protein